MVIDAGQGRLRLRMCAVNVDLLLITATKLDKKR